MEEFINKGNQEDVKHYQVYDHKYNLLGEYETKDQLKQLHPQAQYKGDNLFLIPYDNQNKELEQELVELEKWFSDYFDKQLIQALWQKDYIPSYDVILNKTYKDFDELKHQAQIIRNKLIEYYKKDR